MATRRAFLAWLLLCPTATSAGDPPSSRTTYDEQLAPILREKCFGCHNPDKERGGLSLTTYARLMEGGSSGAVIVPGDADSSRLFLLISRKQEPFMPPKSDRLPDGTLEVIRRWISEGALENAGSKARTTSKPRLAVVGPAGPVGKPEGPPPMPEGLSLAPVLRTERPGPVIALASSPWAPVVAIGGQKQVALYHAESLEYLGILSYPEGIPQVLKFSRNGALLLAGGGHGAQAGRVVVWDVKTGDRVAEVGDDLDVVLAADIRADQSRVALGGPAKVVRVFAPGDPKPLAEIRKHTDWVRCLEYSPDGVLLATADRAGGVWVWEAESCREYLALPGHGAAITDLSWRSDSNLLATACEDGTVRLFEMEGGSQVKRWSAHGGGVLSIEFAHDGRLVTCGRDRRVKVWNPDGGLQRELEAFPDIATAATFTHDGSRVVAGDFQGEVRVWTPADSKRVGALSPNPPSVEQLLAAATADLEARKGEHDGAAKAAEAARSEVTRATEALGAAQERAKDAGAALERASAAVAAAQARVDRLHAAGR